MNRERRLPLASTAPHARDFDAKLAEAGIALLHRRTVTTLQVNVGKLCNMACQHCHVDAGPKRTEVMSRSVVERVVTLLERSPEVRVLDLTGGAPEMNPDFRWLVTEARRLGRRVIDRCNLTVLFEPGMETLATFLADNEVAIVASLPCYASTNVDKQRGKGAYDKSIEALRCLNDLGYGAVGSSLELDLVYNPVGASLPPDQRTLEATYKEELDRLFGISFHRLLTITNMPIQRFAHALARDGQDAAYMDLLVEHFNPAAVDGVMCRSLVSVAYDGTFHDCDFNQMLGMPLGGKRTLTLWDVEDLAELASRSIATASHCFGCTAGAGSSCSGSLT